jgi:elongation factor P
MVSAQQLRNGMAIRFEGQPYKVIAAEYHPGQGKMGGTTHARLLNLGTGTQWEHSFRADLKLEELVLEKKAMQFLYSDGEMLVFMDPVTAEQAEIPAAMMGPRAAFLLPEMPVSLEFLNEKPVNAALPDFLEIRVKDTAPPVHQGGNDNTWKPALLENGSEVMVPQFIKTGDAIRVDLNTMKYMDRAKGAGKS